MKTIPCKTCRRSFSSKNGRMYCSPDCRRAKAPAVYHFTAPDGRDYVGSRSDIRNRHKEGITGSNVRLREALVQYPSETWTFEVLETLPPGCSERELRGREQYHIDRLRSWAPESGFNILPASWEGDGPAQRAARQYFTVILAASREALAAEWLATRAAMMKGAHARRNS
jgi:hypothetical protein